MNESEKLKRQREDSEAASEQLSKVTRKSVINLMVPESIHSFTTVETLRENFNSLLSRVANIETRLLALESKVNKIMEENRIWHK